jgi:hypothetical protein
MSLATNYFFHGTPILAKIFFVLFNIIWYVVEQIKDHSGECGGDPLSMLRIVRPHKIILKTKNDHVRSESMKTLKPAIVLHLQVFQLTDNLDVLRQIVYQVDVTS